MRPAGPRARQPAATLGYSRPNLMCPCKRPVPAQWESYLGSAECLRVCTSGACSSKGVLARIRPDHSDGHSEIFVLFSSFRIVLSLSTVAPIAPRCFMAE
jgi:hypothetical protein